MASLNPAFRVGWQLALLVHIHHRVSMRAARGRAVELLRSVRLPNPSWWRDVIRTSSPGGWLSGSRLRERLREIPSC